MSPEQKKILADCWKKGAEAMAIESWDYAIAMIGKAVALVPDNLLYRQSLRGCEVRRYKQNSCTAGVIDRVKLMKTRGRIAAAKLTHN